MIEKRKPAIRQRPIQVKFFVDEKELSLIKARIKRAKGRKSKYSASEKELSLIKARMAQLGIENMSAYLRQVAIDGYEEKPDFPERRETKNP